MINTFTFHHDGGHGYLEVSYDLLKYLGIDQHVSGYSYLRDKRVYLEEDMDASLFIYAYEAIEKQKPHLINKYWDDLAPCRNYDRYPSTSTESFSETMQLINHYKALCKRNRADVNEKARATN